MPCAEQIGQQVFSYQKVEILFKRTLEMYPFAMNPLLVALLSSLTDSTSTFEMASYLVSLIEHVAKVEIGTAKCIFYGISAENPFDSSLEQVLAAPQLENVTKFVLTGESTLNYTQLPKKPNLIIVHGENVVPISEKIVRTFMIFDPNTRIIVLVNTRTVDFKAFDNLLGKYLLFNQVIYLDEVNQETLMLRIVGNFWSNYFPVPNILFRFLGRYDLLGMSVTYTTEGILMASDPTFKWINETAVFLNASLLEVKHRCHKYSEMLVNKCYINHFIKNNVQIDTTKRYWHALKLKYQSFILTTLTDDHTIVVPRFPINIIQLFTYPFDTEVWIVIMLVLITAEVVKVLFPSVFLNDPILLTVCGYERFSLDHTSALEKIVLQSLTVFMFFVTCAYETKIISIMISKPAAQEIQTMQDLLESGVKIRANLLLMPYLTNHTLLGGIVTNSTGFDLIWDLKHAYVKFRYLAKLEIPKYFDKAQRLYRYRILDESLNMEVRVYKFFERYPLISTFEYALTAFIESGIWTYWNELHERKECGMIGESLETSSFLSFEDIFPAMVFIWYGLVISLFVFVGEIVLNWLQMIDFRRKICKLLVKFYANIVYLIRIQCGKVYHSVKGFS